MEMQQLERVYEVVRKLTKHKGLWREAGLSDSDGDLFAWLLEQGLVD